MKHYKKKFREKKRKNCKKLKNKRIFLNEK